MSVTNYFEQGLEGMSMIVYTCRRTCNGNDIGSYLGGQGDLISRLITPYYKP